MTTMCRAFSNVDSLSFFTSGMRVEQNNLAYWLISKGKAFTKNAPYQESFRGTNLHVHKLVISVMNKASTEIEILLLLLRSVKNKNVSLRWELNF